MSTLLIENVNLKLMKEQLIKVTNIVCFSGHIPASLVKEGDRELVYCLVDCLNDAVNKAEDIFFSEYQIKAKLLNRLPICKVMQLLQNEDIEHAHCKGDKRKLIATYLNETGVV